MDFTALKKALGLDSSNLLDSLHSSSPQQVQSDVGMARSGYQSPYTGMPIPDLAAIDRYSQGQIYGQQYPGVLGYLGSLPGAVLGGVGAEVAKTQTGSALAQALAKRLGADPTQFQIDSTSSPPSLNNILWLLRGQAAGAFGDK